MATDIPLKIRDSQGNLQQFSTSEESYLAYQMALGLAEADSSSVGSLTLDPSGAITVGTFEDTFYTDPVGTHPGTSISGASTVATTLYQVDGTADSSGEQWRIPVAYNTQDNSYREMVDSDFNLLTSRLLSVYATNNYPGSYRLDSDGFSDSDWSSYIASVYTDTQTDGTSKSYSLFKRSSITPPASVARPIAIKRTSGRTGDYDNGVIEFTDEQIKYTLTQKAKTRMMASGIGTYQLRSSAQGAPSAPGTWVAKGIAVDTRKQVSDVDYSRSYVASYTGAFAGTSTTAYTGQFATSYTGQFTETYVGQYASQYSGIYAGTYGGAVSKSYTTTYGGVRSFVGLRFFTGTTTENFTGTATFTGFFVRQYSGTSTRQYTGTRTFSSFYTGELAPGEPESYIASYTGTRNFAGTVTKFFSGTVAKSYTGTRTYTGTTTASYGGLRSFAGFRLFSRTYTGEYTRNYTGTFAGTFTRQYAGSFTTQYTGVYTAQYLADYTAQYTGIYSGTYSGLSYTAQYAGQTILNSPETIETYTLYVKTA